MKSKRKFGFRNDDDDRIICRRILLNTLRAKGAVIAERMIAAAAKQYGFAREDVLAAARHWNLIEEQRDSTIWWRKPEVLTCVPNWNYRPDGPRRAT